MNTSETYEQQLSDIKHGAALLLYVRALSNLSSKRTMISTAPAALSFHERIKNIFLSRLQSLNALAMRNADLVPTAQRTSA
jgi:hypothetical protein